MLYSSIRRGRGRVDEDALLRELQSGRLWAALDVFEEEPLPQNSPFRELENVFLTPHKAGETVETYRKQGMAMVEEVERFFKGEPLKYRVPRDAYAIMA
jgi:phosphoglycerate dehydrogenase-like enzyme